MVSLSSRIFDGLFFVQSIFLDLSFTVIGKIVVMIVDFLLTRFGRLKLPFEKSRILRYGSV